MDLRPKAIKNFLAYSLQRLGVDYIDIYRPARLDPQVPIEDTVGAIADMVKAGYVQPAIYAAILGLLLAVRAVNAWRQSPSPVRFATTAAAQAALVPKAP